MWRFVSSFLRSSVVDGWFSLIQWELLLMHVVDSSYDGSKMHGGGPPHTHYPFLITLPWAPGEKQGDGVGKLFIPNAWAKNAEAKKDYFPENRHTFPPGFLKAIIIFILFNIYTINNILWRIQMLFFENEFRLLTLSRRMQE